MSKSKKQITKGLSDSELSAKYDTGANAKNDFDQTINNMIKTPSQSSSAKTKK